MNSRVPDELIARLHVLARWDASANNCKVEDSAAYQAALALRCPEKMRGVRRPILDRLWDRTIRGGAEECWLWTGAVDRFGYGKIGAPKPPFRSILAHRASWEAHNGPILGGLFVCHRCDVRNCVNPAHLWLGTNDENMADMVAKKRAGSGAANRNARLTKNQADEIRQSTKPHQEIARQFGISASHVGHIKSGKRWAA